MTTTFSNRNDVIYVGVPSEFSSAESASPFLTPPESSQIVGSNLYLKSSRPLAGAPSKHVFFAHPLAVIFLSLRVGVIATPLLRFHFFPLAIVTRQRFNPDCIYATRDDGVELQLSPFSFFLTPQEAIADARDEALLILHFADELEANIQNDEK